MTLPVDLNERQVHVTDRPTDKYRKNDAFLWVKFIRRYVYDGLVIILVLFDVNGCIYLSRRYDFYIFVPVTLTFDLKFYLCPVFCLQQTVA